MQTIEKEKFLENLKNRKDCFENKIFDFEISSELLKKISHIKNSQIDFKLDFNNTHFKKKVDFSGFTFLTKISFFQATFSDEAVFINARFTKTVDFHKAKFLSHANFISARFEKSANFQIATFSSYAYFYQAEFFNVANFGFIIFSGEADFALAKFSGEVYFSSTEFQSSVAFHKAIFLNKTYFNHTKLPENHNSYFCDLNKDEIQPKIPQLFFKNIIFPDKVLFSGCNLSQTIFKDCFIAEIKFINCYFSKTGRGVFKRDDFYIEKKEVERRNIKMFFRKSFCLEEKKKQENKEQLCRQMKTSLEKSKNWKQAGDFYIGEMEAKRKKSWQDNLKLSFYKYFLGYAERISIIVIWIILLLFATAYFLPFISNCTVDRHILEIPLCFEKASKLTIFPLTLRLELRDGDPLNGWEIVFLLSSWIFWIALATAIRRRFRF